MDFLGDTEETFSKEEYPGNGKGKKTLFFQLLREKKIRELSGDYITAVCLPDTLKKIGNLAFYQCRKLKKIAFAGEKRGKEAVFELGSDAFMNCRSLNTFLFFYPPEIATGLRRILAQQRGETIVYFKDTLDSLERNLSEKEILFSEEKNVTAAVLFPEYSEQYDLIGPAHIFELNIEGEGLRARQCFENEVFQFEKYDQVFLQACDTEEERTLCKMAALRLCYPVALKTEAKEQYQSYLLLHGGMFCELLVRERSLKFMEALAEQGIFEEKHWEICIRKTVEAKWPEGTRSILAWKKRKRQKDEEEAYGFEDF